MACKNYADSSSSYLAYGLQTECGTPADQLTFMRITSNGLQLTAESTESGEIRSDRNVSDLIRNSVSVGGTIGFELSFTDFLEFFRAALQVDNNDLSLGQYNGSTRKYFTFEDKITTDSGDYFRVFSDCEINELSITLEQGAIVVGTMTIIGRVHTTSTTGSIDLDGIDAASTDPVYNTVNHIGSIQLDGGETCDVSSMDINITNNAREQRSLCADGDLGPAGVGMGNFSASGSISIYFADDMLYNKFLNDEEFTVLVLLDDETGVVNGNQYEFFYPRVKFSDLTRQIEGANTDVLMSGSYQALVGSGDGEGALRITATPKADV